MADKKLDLQLVFKPGEGRLRIFKLNKDRRVTHSNYVDFDDAGVVCDCSEFRLLSKCKHLDMVNQKIRTVYDNGMDTRTLARDRNPSTDAPFMHLYIKKDNVYGIASDEFQAVPTAMDLVTELVSPMAGTYPEGKDSNVSRIYSQLNYADVNNLGLLNSEVLAVGDMIVTAKRKAPAAFAKTKRPDPTDFYVEPETWQQCIYALSEGSNILLTGPSGCGKSELCYRASKALGLNLEAFNMGAMSEPRTTLIGNVNFDKDRGTWFSPSRFVKAVMQDKNAILLDELTRANQAAFNILLPLLDGQGYLALDEDEDSPVIERHEGVSFVATANIGMEYTGTTAMDKALKDRFGVIIDLMFPNPNMEEKILFGRVKGLGKPMARKLAMLADRQRHLTRNEEEFSEYISTRMLLEAAKQIAAGIDFKIACKFTIQNHFSAEGGDSSERVKVARIIEKG